jgi:ASC-1-like (ASCH) protein
MLIFPLKKEWFDKIKSGEKTIEYREVKPYWSKRLYTEMCTRLENE